MTAKETWRENLPAEAAFWEDWVANNEKGQIRFAADFPFPDNARQALGEGLKEISALDLGSGPASTVGSYWPGHEVRLTYVDPLADEYNALLRRHGLDRFATIVKGSGETLREDVKPGFDYVHSGNALDHAHDPVLCIQNMIDVAKPGGIIQFLVFQNEGRFENYAGLHQWDFDLVGGNVVVSRRDGTPRPLEPLLKRIESFDPKIWFYEGMGRNAITVTMRRRSRIPWRYYLSFGYRGAAANGSRA